ncbi:MAG TPA: hypothetical protein VGH20_21755 [Myxococcales bacterium]
MGATFRYFAVAQRQFPAQLHTGWQPQFGPQVQVSAFVQPQDFFSHRQSF